jgi:thymidylate synthase (FAD)
MSKISVELIDHIGTDLSVVNAARVSFDKTSDWVQRPYAPGDDNLTLLDEEIPSQLQEYDHYPRSFDDQGRELSGFMLSRKDEKLIEYLAKHNHKSPFNHCFASFRVKAPIFCARQLVKHEYMPWNEISRRYVDSEPEFYTHDTWRKKADNVKQGSSDEAVDSSASIPYFAERLEAAALETYQRMLDAGVCAEQARAILPLSTMTEWIWSGSLFAIAKMCKLRLDPHTQYETRLVAQPIAEMMAELYPVSWRALMAS